MKRTRGALQNASMCGWSNGQVGGWGGGGGGFRRANDITTQSPEGKRGPRARRRYSVTGHVGCHGDQWQNEVSQSRLNVYNYYITRDTAEISLMVNHQHDL